MISSICVVIFDLGGTLFYEKDPWPPYYQRANAALIQTLRDAKLNIEPSTFFRGHHGLFDLYYDRRGDDTDEETTGVLLRQLLKEQGNLNVNDAVIANALHAMYEITQANWHLEEDALSTLQTLRQRGFRVGIISNGADDVNTQTLIDKADIRSYFDYIISSAALGTRKPHPKIFRAALDHFNVPAKQVVMIGDTLDADILGAHQVGMKSIWITRRAAETAIQINVKPDAIVSALSEIPPLLST
jgi:putative hydrolase of the HAD superfamily